MESVGEESCLGDELDEGDIIAFMGSIDYSNQVMSNSHPNKNGNGTVDV